VEILTNAVHREISLGQPQGWTVRDEASKDGQSLERRAYVQVRSGKTELIKPRDYRVTGWVRANPTNGQIVLVSESLEPLPDALDSFDPLMHGPELVELRTLGVEAIVNDLAEHVTRIYDSPDQLLTVLLAWCSPIWITFQGERIRGWINVALVGDSATGKTWTFKHLHEFLGLGDVFSSQTGSRTGLVYSIIAGPGGMWSCKAGLFPRSSRRILCVEEAQELPADELRTLKEAMDSGIVRVERAAHAHYEATTRLVLLANPPLDKPLSSYRYGCQAAADVFEPTLLRRLDALVLLKGTKHTPREKSDATRKVSAGALKSLVMYAWSLRADQVHFSSAAQKAAIEAGHAIGHRFGVLDKIPISPPAVAKQNIIRLASAYAILSVSTTGRFERVEVEASHVEAVKGLLERLYGSEVCGIEHLIKEKDRG
jgi:hypothetical protein